MESGRQYLDTNILAILHSGNHDKLGRTCIKYFKKNFTFYFSPIVKLELHYLFEIHRIRFSAIQIISDLQEIIDLRECDTPFITVVHEAIKHSWTRDPFDRIIVAQASLQKSILLTRDKLILQNYKYAMW